MNLAVNAAELRLQEIARIKAALVPRLEALRSMTAPEFRTVIALKRCNALAIGLRRTPTLPIL